MGKARHTVRIADVEGAMTDPPYDRELKVLLSPRLGSTQNSAVGLMTLGPGKSSGLHQHEVAEEVWYIVSGRGKVRIGEDVEDVEPHMVVFGPPRIPHGFINEGAQPLVAVFTISPAGDEAMALQKLAEKMAREERA